MTRTEIQELHAEEIFSSDQVLVDNDKRGRSRDWRGKKMRNELLAAVYDSVDTQKAARLRDCGKLLRYRIYEDGTKVLDSMASCRVRLCPICTWRRSLKIYGQTRQIVDKLAETGEFHYVMLTLTVRNCTGDELADTVDRMVKSWHRFLGLKGVEKVCRGWYRSLEIVHDTYPFITEEMYYGDKAKHVKSRKAWYDKHGYHVGDENPNYDTFHPHFHVLVAVDKYYFKSRDYLSQKAWAALWKGALQADYEPRVDVRRVYGGTSQDLAKAVCEVAKYACKDTDYIVPDDWELSIATVRILDKALDRRRLVAYGGVMKETKRFLKQDDVEDGDLVHIGDYDAPEDQNFRILSYWWYSGYRQYYEL